MAAKPTKGQSSKRRPKRATPSALFSEPQRRLLERYEERIRALELRIKSSASAAPAEQPLQIEGMQHQPGQPEQTEPQRRLVEGYEARMRALELWRGEEPPDAPAEPLVAPAQRDDGVAARLRREWQGFQQVNAQRITEVLDELERLRNHLDQLPRAELYCHECSERVSLSTLHETGHQLAAEQRRIEGRFPIFRGEDPREGHIHRTTAEELYISFGSDRRTFTT